MTFPFSFRGTFRPHLGVLRNPLSRWHSPCRLPERDISASVVVPLLGGLAMLDPKRCRARAQEFLRLSALAQTAEIAERYKDLADAYGRLADHEEELSSQTER